jgi:hypothetical protein
MDWYSSVMSLVLGRQLDEMQEGGTLSSLRGPWGYCKYDNGLLDVTPMGPEIDIVKQNATDSPLLRLPAEIRVLIWEYALYGVLRVQHLGYQTTDGCRFSLLRVSRSTYAETALLVWGLNTVEFTNIGQFRWLARDRRLGLVRNVLIRDYPSPSYRVAHELPLDLFKLFPSVEIITFKWTKASKSTQLFTQRHMSNAEIQADTKSALQRHFARGASMYWAAEGKGRENEDNTVKAVQIKFIFEETD